MSRRIPVAVAVAVFALALAVLLALGNGHREPTLPRQAAVRAALADPVISRQLSRHGYDRSRVTALDGRLARVTFFDGPRIRAVAAVDAQGRVEHAQVFTPGAPRFGSKLSDAPWLLALLALGFALATVTLPIRSVRNVDVLALLALTVPILAGDHQLFALSVLSGYPPLAYLCGRCVWRAATGREPAAATPLHTRARLPRLLPYAIATTALLLGIVAVTSPGAIDVGRASAEGATLLLHGTLPYGHMPPDVVHGDTYPLLGYALYLPAAAIAPVRDAFDDTSSAVLAAFAAALVVAVALRRGGPRVVLAWLCFPPLAVAVASGTNDLLLAAAVVLALVLASRCGRSALALAAGVWIKLAPLVLLPLWLARTRALGPLARAAAATLGLSAALTGWILVLGGPGGLARMLHALSFQLERGTLQSAWGLLDAGGAQRVAEAATVALIAWSALMARKVVLDPARLAALCGAVLAALQISATNWSYLYLVWLFPCVALGLIADRSELPAGATARGPARRCSGSSRRRPRAT